MSRLNRTVLICEENISALENTSGYLWYGYTNSNEKFSLLALLEKNSLYFRNKLQNLISNFIGISAEKLEFHIPKLSNSLLLVFGNSFVEQSPFKSEAWINTLRLLVLENELNCSHVKKIIYRGTNRQVNQCLQKLSQKKGLEYELIEAKAVGKGGCFYRIWKSLPLLLRAPIYLCRYLLKRWPLRLIEEPKWFAEENSLFFFSYFIHLDPKSGASGQFYSKQWEQLPKKLQAQGFRLNWIHLFLTSTIIPDANVGRKWIEAFENDSVRQGHHALLDQYLDWAIVAKVVKDWFLAVSFYITKGRSLQNCLADENEWLCPVLRTDWEDSWIGPVAIHNLLLVYLFDKALGSIPRQKLGFYLQENQGWERIFLYFWHKHEHGKIIGVPHSTVRYWDLRYFDTPIAKVFPDLPQPDAVAVNGLHAWRMLEESGYPMRNCVPVEALRYQYLKNLEPVNLSEVPQMQTRVLLVLGDIQAETTHQMLLHLENAYFSLESQFDVWVKPHPANPVDLEKYPKLQAVLKEEFLQDLLPEAGVVLASVFTSASLDAFCAGLPVINYLDPKDFNFSPLRGHPSARFASSTEEIQGLLQDEEWLSTPSGAKPTDFFWLDEELPRWTQLIQSIFAENSEVNEQCSN